MKRFLWILLIGFLLGTTLTGLFSPRIISWYFDPPTSIGVSCGEAVRWGIVAYQKAILGGGIVGLVLALVWAISSYFNSPGNSTKSQNETSKMSQHDNKYN